MNPVSHDDHERARVDQRLTDLEVKLSFTEDLVEHLERLVVQQQAQIERLLRELGTLRRQFDDSGVTAVRSLRDELPPHY